MIDKIVLLAREKDFSALSMAEQRWVLSEMSQIEFEHLRAILLAAPQMDANVQPSARLGSVLRAKMAESAKPSLFKRLITAKMPVWLAVLAIGIFWAIGNFSVRRNAPEKTIREVQWRTDTLWQVKTLWRERVVERKNLKIRKKPVVEPLATVSITSDSQALRPVPNAPEFNTPRVGTSLADTPELMRFFTQGDR